MNPRLKQLLAHLADTLDETREREIAERHERALRYEPTDRLPVIAAYPPPADDPWRSFPHGETFDDPEKMLFNELVGAFDTRLVRRAEVGDDLPAAIRPNFGTVLVASAFGARVEWRGDDPPWAMPFATRAECAAALARGPASLADGWLPRVVERYRFYRDALAQFPPLDRIIALTLPDLQGPLDTLEMLRGSELYADLAEEPEQTAQWLATVARAQVDLARALWPLVHEPRPGFTHQHGFVVTGNILIRNDSAIMLSPAMYREQVAPHDEFVLRELGGGSVHSCGNFMHQIPGLLELPSLRGLDFGQPRMNDVARACAAAAPRRVPLLRVRVTPGELAAPDLRRRFPTGVSLLLEAGSRDEARDALQSYRMPRRDSMS